MQDDDYFPAVGGCGNPTSGNRSLVAIATRSAPSVAATHNTVLIARPYQRAAIFFEVGPSLLVILGAWGIMLDMSDVAELRQKRQNKKLG